MPQLDGAGAVAGTETDEEAEAKAEAEAEAEAEAGTDDEAEYDYLEQLTDDQLEQLTGTGDESEDKHLPDFFKKLPASDRLAYHANADNAMEMCRGKALDEYLNVLN